VSNPERPLNYLIEQVTLARKSSGKVDYLNLYVTDILGRDYAERNDDENDIKNFMKLGETEFVKKYNEENFVKFLKQKSALEEDRTNYDDKNASQAKSIDRRLLELNKWIERYSDWFLKNGYEIPKKDHLGMENGAVESHLNDKQKKGLVTELEALQKKVDRLESENENLNVDIRIRQEKYLQLKKRDRLKEWKITKDQLREIINQTRKKNGKQNFAKIGRELGCDNETAKKRVRDMGLLE
jgi:hypothetical protein